VDDRLQVVCGILVKNRRLATFRRKGGGENVAGKWEFPGGKVEPSESLIQALTRELQEELSISVLSTSSVGYVDWDYPELSLRLHVFIVSEWEGEIILHEHAGVLWDFYSEVENQDLAGADREILKKIENEFTL